MILIDCAPTESILTDAAYFASRFVLVPVKPEFMAAIGLPLIARSLHEFKADNADHALDICGIVFNHSSSYSAGPEAHQSISEVTEIAIENDWPVFETHLTYSASYAKAAREGASIGSTSYVRYNVTRNFSSFAKEFFDAISLDETVP